MTWCFHFQPGEEDVEDVENLKSVMTCDDQDANNNKDDYKEKVSWIFSRLINWGITNNNH